MKQSTREVIESCAHIAIAVAVIISSSTLFFYYKISRIQGQRLEISTFRDASLRMHAAFRNAPDPANKKAMDAWHLEILGAFDYFIFLVQEHEIEAETRLFYERDMANYFAWINDNDPELINFLLTDPKGARYKHLHHFFEYLSEKKGPD
ncbi:MAG: hypothetical protein ACUZ8A_02355 [Candidatus Bathyanammoxibius sp.]